MQHVDPEVLALVALGEDAPAAERAHLDACTACARQMASLAAAVAVGRTVRSTDAPVAPPPAVWERIRSELALSVPAVPTPASPPAPDLEAPGPATVVPSRRRAVPWVAAAACGLLVGGVGGAWWAGRTTEGPPADVVAQAPLDPLPGWQAQGEARVEIAADGARTLVVTLDGSGARDGYHEVWLIDRGVTRLVSLGVLAGPQGRFTVPPGLDLREFPVVDVSDEPYDGDPSHSGASIIRGVLDT